MTSTSPVVRWLRSPWPRSILLVLLLSGSAWFSIAKGFSSVDEAREWVAGLGVFAPVVWVLLYGVAAMAFFPVSLLSAAAGVLFGGVGGAVVSWLGAMLGALGSFLLGRALSRDAVEQLSGGRMAKLDVFLKKRGTFAVCYLRFLPIGPFALFNYGASITTLSLRQFLLGTGMGITPGIIIYAALGHNITDPASPAFLISVAALILLAVGGAILARRTRQ